MTTTKDLVQAIQSGKSADIQSTFEAVMAQKVQDAMGAYRAAVVEGIFESKGTDEEDEAAKDSSLDESEELQLEDYSLEEIQEFMVSEDFESLDELSKKTLANYVSKAALDVGSKAFTGGTEIEKNKHNVGSAGANTGARTTQKAFNRVINIGKAASRLSK